MASVKNIITWWARLDSNQRPRDYESPALTAELRARDKLNVERKYSYDTSCHRDSNTSIDRNRSNSQCAFLNTSVPVHH